MKNQLLGIFGVITAVFILIPSSQGQVRMTIRLSDMVEQESTGRIQFTTVDGLTTSTFGYAPIWSLDSLAMFSLSSDPGHLIHNSQVRKDLELDRDQIKELADIQKEFQQRANNATKQAQSGKALDTKKWNELIQQIQKERKAALGAVLLPHQSKRLKQIATQMEMRNRGDAIALTGQKLADELGIDDKQKQELQKRAREIKLELQNQIAKLKEDARNKLLRELRPVQRQKLDELIGDQFVPKPNNGRRSK